MAEQEQIQRLKAAKGWIFDMDGVVYRGTDHLPGVQEMFDELDYRGIPFQLATNNSMATPAQYVERLAGMHITVTEDKILTSAMGTQTWLIENLGSRARIHVVGMPSLTAQLLDGSEFTLVDPDEAIPDAVVVGMDREISYDKLRKAHKGIIGGARFVATNADVTLPTEQGLVPGCGAIIAAIAASTGVQPVVIGKPEVYLTGGLDACDGSCSSGDGDGRRSTGYGYCCGLQRRRPIADGADGSFNAGGDPKRADQAGSGVHGPAGGFGSTADLTVSPEA